MELIPLGTSSASIIRDRGLPAYVLRNNGNIFLFDCGDGTQFRLLHARVRFSRIKAIFISHLHGDHYLGLFGLLISMSLQRRKASLTIVAPRELVEIVNAHPGVRQGDLCFPVQYVKLDEGVELEHVYEEPGFRVSARPLEHGGFCVGYRAEKEGRSDQINSVLARDLGITEPEQFQRLAKGETVEIPEGKMISPDQVRCSSRAVFTYVTDTCPCQTGFSLAKDANILVHEATFIQEDAERAMATGHSTAYDAALVAKKAGAERLLLTHLSSRYSDITLLRNEAKAVFPNTEIAEEYRTYPIRSRHFVPQTNFPA